MLRIVHGVSKVEVFVGSDKVKELNYSGSSTSVQENVNFAIPFGDTNDVEVKVNGTSIYTKSVTNMRYISTAADMVAFRDAVNGGNTFEGKYVDVIADIDMSSVCSSSLGSWVPIGYGVIFQGTLNGNHHTLSNLYYNDSTRTLSGLLGHIGVNGTAKSINLSNVNINNTSAGADSFAGGIAGYSQGKIYQCATLSGNITASQNT